MGVNSGLELNNDILYVKKVFDKYSNTYKKIKRNIKNKNKMKYRNNKKNPILLFYTFKYFSHISLIINNNISSTLLTILVKKIKI